MRKEIIDNVYSMRNIWDNECTKTDFVEGDGGYTKSDQEYEASWDMSWSEEEKKNCLAEKYTYYKKDN